MVHEVKCKAVQLILNARPSTRFQIASQALASNPLPWELVVSCYRVKASSPATYLMVLTLILTDKPQY